nr:RNA polymerase sigma-70 factor [uncultured Bacteroides sp.]
MLVENILLNNFSSLYSYYYKKSFLFTKSYVHDEMVAEDIVSDVLIKLWDILKEKPVDNFEPLLLTMLKNRSLDYLKHELVKSEAFKQIADIYKQDLEIRVSSLEACEPTELLSAEVQEILAQTLASLPERTRLIFELSRYSDKSNKEIAKMLNISVKSVEYHMTQALKLLRTNLKDYFPSLLFFLFFI